ncbi:MAG: hypothetical protein JRF56_07885 [Deltaproteobacteria bacterium]|jgi:hypothetical protein|nr:hypothetical protein [Deltaproteobacteria bacterium]
MVTFNLFSNEKRALKILFWCITPLLFLAFFRLFWLVFGFIFGGLLRLILGSQLNGLITTVSIVTALVFSILTCRYVYRQFKKHII